MTTELQEISDRLAALIANPAARIGIVVETGYDEAGMVATADGYLRLAQALVEFVCQAHEGKAQVQQIGGVSVSVTSLPGDVFGPGEVSLDSTLMAGTEAEVQQVTAYFQRLSPQAEPSAI